MEKLFIFCDNECDTSLISSKAKVPERLKCCYCFGETFSAYVPATKFCPDSASAFENQSFSFEADAYLSIF